MLSVLLCVLVSLCELIDAVLQSAGYVFDNSDESGQIS
jgi:phage-related holin